MRFYSKNLRTKKTDLELVQKYQDFGDVAAFEELFQRYCHLVYGACLKYFSNEEHSKDAVLEIFEKVMSKLDKQPVTNFNSWLYSITKNYCLDKLRKIKKQNEVAQENDKISKNIFMEFEDFDNLYSSDENWEEKLHAAINQLNEAQRRCIQLFYFKKKSYEDISKETGFDRKKVKSHIQNGKRNLKNLLIQKEVFRDEK